MKKTLSILLATILAFSFFGCFEDTTQTNPQQKINSIDNIPNFYGMAYIKINDNVPQFKDNEITDKSYENYSPLDYLGRCGVASACIGTDIMPTEERGEIGMIKPTGWHTVKYEVVDGKYLYNRCHLIGYQLTGENANEQNLITGTRFLNIEGMLPFENMIADYIKETGNHVMYRVTPIFEGINLLCKGVHMEGYSVEDNGDGISFNVFAYNAQPQVEINYLTGESAQISNMLPDGTNSKFTSSVDVIPSNESLTYAESQIVSAVESVTEKEANYIINKNSKKIHLDSCSHAKKIKEENREEFKETIEKYINKGYSLCQTCLKDKKDK